MTSAVHRALYMYVCMNDVCMYVCMYVCIPGNINVYTYLVMCIYMRDEDTYVLYYSKLMYVCMYVCKNERMLDCL